jgi:lantibiotic modifying enzyme
LDTRIGAKKSAVATIPKQQHAWCHGAPGIGLARLLMVKHCTDAEIKKEVETAVETTLSRAFTGSHCLCHGMLGNVELLLQATQSPLFANRSDWQARARDVSAQIVRDIAMKGPLCANPGSLESPGLMTGLAGIGYGLLRIADAKSVPSVLALAPPTVAALQTLRSVA